MAETTYNRIALLIREACAAAHTHGWIQACLQRGGNSTYHDGVELEKARRRMEDAERDLHVAVATALGDKTQ